MTTPFLEGAAKVLLERATAETSALVQRFPDLGQVLSRFQGALPPFVLDASDGTPIDLVVDNGRYYGRDARDIAKEQVEAALARGASFVGRTTLPAVGHGRMHDIAAGVLKKFDLPSEQQERPASWAEGWSRLLVFCGTGLGFHILPLIERLDPRYVVVYEPHPELLYSSTFSVPWRRLIERLSGSGRGLLVVSGGTPEAALVNIHAWLQKIPAVNYDGGRWIEHNANPAFVKFREIFTEQMMLLNRGIGFFFDERRQFINTFGNLGQTNGLLGEARPDSLDGDLIVVGSGPSLDKALPLLQRVKDRAIVFSCGTGLTPLLRSGIRPDFHIELETSTQRYALARTVDDPEIFEKTTLIASNGYYPPSLALFRNRLSFLRPMNFAALSFRELAPILTYAFPTVTNAAVALGHWFGFRRIYAFGLDLGYHDKELQHSKRSLYFNERAGAFHKDFTHIPGATQLRSFYAESRIEIEDNQGGRMFTNEIFHTSLLGFGNFLRATSANLIQCGLGARIDKAKVRRIEDLSESDFHCNKASVIAEIHRRFKPVHVPRELMQSVLDEERRKLDVVLGDMEAIRAKPIASQMDFTDRLNLINLRLRDPEPAELALRSLIYGDLEKFNIFLADLVSTAGTPSLKRALWESWQDGMAELIRHMRDQMASVVPGEGIEPLPDAPAPRG